jgi:hypothetical protein
LFLERAPRRQSELLDAPGRVAPGLDLVLAERLVQALDRLQQRGKLRRFHEQPLLFELHPAGSAARRVARRAEGDVLLTTFGNDRQLRERRGKQQGAHGRLVPLSEWCPLVVFDKVRIVLHPLRLVLAGARLQVFRALLEPEQAGGADDIPRFQ